MAAQMRCDDEHYADGNAVAAVQLEDLAAASRTNDAADIDDATEYLFDSGKG